MAFEYIADSLALELQNKGWTVAQLDALDGFYAETDADQDHPYNDCSDNFRLARKDNGEEMRVYDDANSSGCCGSYDIEIETPDGTILIGFNYGH